MMKWRRVQLSGLVLFGLLLGFLVLLGLPSGVAADPVVEVVASGLDNPRGLAFGPEGALYVVEAGRGAGGPCAEPIAGPFGPACYGPTGAVTRIHHGGQERIATGLSSFASPAGGQAFGSHDIAFQGRGGAYVIVGACFAPNESCGQLVHLPASGKWRPIANVRAFELANNPDGRNDGETNPYAVLALPGERIVADAAGNTVLRVAANGHVSLLAVFPPRMVNGFLMDAVPTAIAMGPDGAFYISELTGFPFPVGGARIYRLVPGQAPEIFADGFTTVIDIAFESDGSLLVLEHATNSLLSGDPTGALIRLNPDGTRETLLTDGLMLPTAVAVGDDGAVYISNNGQSAGVGEVLRVTLDE